MINQLRVREAVAQARWADAIELLDADHAASETSEGAAELELRGVAAYGAGDPEASIAAWESLYRLHVTADERIPAARAAAMVAMYLMIDSGLMSPIRGWLRRSERLIEDCGETPVHAVVAMVRTYERLWCGDMEGAGINAHQSIELGRRHRVPAAVLVATVAMARLHIFRGDTDVGVEILDDVALTLTSGDVDDMTSGMAYCEIICAAQGLALYERAAEWTEAMERWSRRSGFGGFSGRCRVHRAEIFRLTGPCARAEDEALEACEELRPWMRREFGWPLTELGNIRLRRGDLAGAEEAFLAAHGNSWTPQPGLALLRLAQGEIETAAELIKDAIDHPFDVPSKERPPYGGLRIAPLLDAQVEIAVAGGDLGTARRAADSLLTIADSFQSRALSACAAQAQGRAFLAEDDALQAIQQCQRALVVWIEIGAPFEAAVVRMTLGPAQARCGNLEGARMEWRAAQRAFEAYGAVGWAEQARSAANGLRVQASPAPESRPSSIFRCEGDTRTVSFDGVTVLIHDLKGFRYLQRLLVEPNREFHALDLLAVERGSLPTTGRTLDSGDVSHREGHAGLHLDDQARQAYRRRLIDIDEDIDHARRMNDLERVALAEADREYLIKELSRAIGLGGRPRAAGATSERARTSVTRSLRYAVARIAEHHPHLGEHLRRAVVTGTYCAYRPDPRIPSSWQV